MVHGHQGQGRQGAHGNGRQEQAQAVSTATKLHQGGVRLCQTIRRNSPMPIDVACSCGKKLSAPEKYAGKRVRCPGCQAVVVIPEPVVEPEILEEEAISPEVLEDEDDAA